MSSGIARKSLKVKLAVFALLVSRLAPPQAHARDEVSFVFHTVSWGMIRGQTSRITVFNPIDPSARKQPGVVSIQVKLFDASGAEIATSAERSVPPGESRSLDFDRDDLPLAGEPRGGRLQTRAQIRYRFFAIVDRTQLLPPPTSIELINDLTGHTTVLIAQRTYQIISAGKNGPFDVQPGTPIELPVIVYSGRGLIGLTHGQTLRVSAHHPGDRRGQSRSLRGRVSLFDADGELLARSAAAPIAPGEFYSFDFDRAAIAAAGAPVSGRLQMRVSIEVEPGHPSSFAQDPKSSGLLPTILELVDNSTGITTAVWVTVGFFEVESSTKP